jgi:hypothetical protein
VLKLSEKLDSRMVDRLCNLGNLARGRQEEREEAEEGVCNTRDKRQNAARTVSRNDEGKKPPVSDSDFNVDASTRMEVEDDAFG